MGLTQVVAHKVLPLLLLSVEHLVRQLVAEFIELALRGSLCRNI